jgi:hypothetical protein
MLFFNVAVYLPPFTILLNYIFFFGLRVLVKLVT